MPTRETVTHSELILAHNSSISTNTTTNGAIIDTKDADGGVSFYLGAAAYTDGTFKLVIKEGDDSGLSDATTVGSTKLVEASTATGAVTTGISAITADLDAFSKVAVHSTKRFLRPQIVSTGTSSGATIDVLAQLTKEVQPVG